MDENLEKDIQESLDDRARIEKELAEREKKDLKIISRFCAENNSADMYNILTLLEKYNGIADHDKRTVEDFRQSYPGKLTVKLISMFNDVKDIYSRYLESGGEENG